MQVEPSNVLQKYKMHELIQFNALAPFEDRGTIRQLHFSMYSSSSLVFSQLGIHIRSSNHCVFVSLYVLK